MADLVGMVNTSSQNPAFTHDRFGNANGAILVSSVASSWSFSNANLIGKYENIHTNLIDTY
jgi:hypothetical protein